MVWNRQRFLKDPDTGKRVARPNPQSTWITQDVPKLRIIDDETWQAVRDRYASVQKKWSTAVKENRFRQFRRPKYLFSGLTKRRVWPGGGPASDRAERQSGRDADRRPTNEKAA